MAPFSTTLARLNAACLLRFGAQQLLDGVPVQADFVKPGRCFTLSYGIEIEARVPVLVVADGDVPAVPEGKVAVCDDGLGSGPANYRVTDAKPDGFGLTVLELERVLP